MVTSLLLLARRSAARGRTARTGRAARRPARRRATGTRGCCASGRPGCMPTSTPRMWCWPPGSTRPARTRRARGTVRPAPSARPPAERRPRTGSACGPPPPIWPPPARAWPPPATAAPSCCCRSAPATARPTSPARPPDNWAARSRESVTVGASSPVAAPAGDPGPIAGAYAAGAPLPRRPAAARPLRAGRRRRRTWASSACCSPTPATSTASSSARWARSSSTTARRGTDLVRTLDAYFASGMSPARTKDDLHVHVNTVAQRLERIGRLLGPDWQSPAPRAGDPAGAAAARDVCRPSPADTRHRADPLGRSARQTGVLRAVGSPRPSGGAHIRRARPRALRPPAPPRLRPDPGAGSPGRSRWPPR